MSTAENPFGGGVPRRKIAAPEEVKAGALVVPPPVRAEELQVHDLAYREAGKEFPGAHEVLFEDCFEDGSFDDRGWYDVPVIYGQSAAGRISQAARWQKIMSTDGQPWPRLPTFEEALAWQAATTSEAQNALVDRVMIFREKFAECERLAQLGGVAFWRPKMSLPPDRAGLVSIADVTTWLLDVADVTVAAWRKQLEDDPGAKSPGKG